MTEREQDEQPQDSSDESTDDFVRDIEEDPSTAGGEDEPADELRGG